MAKFCRYCGNPVREDANFCRSCGKRLTAARPEARQQPPANPAPQRTNTPTYSAPQTTRQAPTRQTVRTTVQTPANTAVPQETKARQAPAQNQTRTTSQRAAEAARQAAMTPQVQNLAAASSAGEIDLGVFELSGLSGLTEPTVKVLSPVSGILHGVGSFFGGIVGVFKKPGALICTVLLAALWYVLAGLRGSDSGLVKFLSFLTFSEGGFDRSALGTVGGILGKGTVGAVLVSLFSGGLKNLFRGIGALFTGHGEKRSFVSVLFGVVIGAAVYFAFAGKNASADTAMAGVAGAILSLEALGGERGKLYELAQSLTSRASNGVRTAMRGKCDGFLTGLTIGFALATALAASGVLEGLL